MCSMCPVSVALRMGQTAPVAVTAVGFEPMPLRTGTWSQRLRPIGQTVRWHNAMAICKRDAVYHNVWFACMCPAWVYGVCHDRVHAYMVCPPMSYVWCAYACPSRLSWCWHTCMSRVAVCPRWPLSASRDVRVPVVCGSLSCRVPGPASDSRRYCG